MLMFYILLSSQQSAIEEQVSAIAYLELFVRTITEPSLLRAFLHFILVTKHDDVVILEWLIDRINSSTKVSDFDILDFCSPHLIYISLLINILPLHFWPYNDVSQLCNFEYHRDCQIVL